MSRFLRFALLALIVVGLSVPGAQADDPVPTKTRLFTTDGPGGTSTVLAAHLWSASGVPTGTVVFFKASDPTPLGAPVPVDATGTASLTVPKSTGSYRAEFTGTGGFANSTGSAGFVFPEQVVLAAEPTLIRIGGPGLLKLNLTMAAHIHYTDGGPAVGQTILFTVLGPARGASGHPEMSPGYVAPVEVCRATVDLTGLASCKGSGTLAAIVSILTLGGYANAPGFPMYQSVYLPPLLVG